MKALIIPLVFISFIINAQLPKFQKDATHFFYSERPRLDSSIDIAHQSVESCYQLIRKMYVIDQQYRDSLHRNWNDEKKSQHFIHQMAINDPVHQSLLLKILKRHGWPCNKNTFNRDLSDKAWIIAWHARADLKKMALFYPYLTTAKQNNCIHPNQFREYRKAIGLLKRTNPKSN